MTLPTPTVLGQADGYIPTGKTRYLFIPTVANLSAPTSAEVTAGSDLTKLVAAVAGFSGQGATIDFPNAGTRITPKISGLITMQDSTVTLNRDVGGTDASTLFDDGSDGSTQTSGVFGIADTGITASAPLQLFRVTVTSVEPSRDIGAARTDLVTFAVYEIGPVTTVPSA